MMGCNNMKDFNFFSSYSRKNERKTADKTILIINGLVILIVLGIMSCSMVNFITIRKLNKDIDILNAELEISRKNPKISEILEKNKEASRLKGELSKIYALDSQAEKRDAVSGFILEAVKDCTPSELFLKSMVVNQSGIRIEGRSKDKESIARFGHNLSALEKLNKVFIPQIKAADGYFSFYLEIELGEEMPDGVETGEK